MHGPGATSRRVVPRNDSCTTARRDGACRNCRADEFERRRSGGVCFGKQKAPRSARPYRSHPTPAPGPALAGSAKPGPGRFRPWPTQHRSLLPDSNWRFQTGDFKPAISERQFQTDDFKTPTPGRPHPVRKFKSDGSHRPVESLSSGRQAQTAGPKRQLAHTGSNAYVRVAAARRRSRHNGCTSGWPASLTIHTNSLAGRVALAFFDSTCFSRGLSYQASPAR